MISRNKFLLFLLVSLLMTTTVFVFSYPKFTTQTGYSCSYCHLESGGASALNANGRLFKQNKFQFNSLPAPKKVTLSSYDKDVRSQLDQGGTVVILPFEVKSDRHILQKIYENIAFLFQQRGYSVISRKSIQRGLFKLNLYGPSIKDPFRIKQIAEEFKADRIVSGSMEYYNPYTEWKGGNMIAFPPGLGLVKKGGIHMIARIFDGKTGEKIWENTHFRQKKMFLGGAFFSDSALMNSLLAHTLKLVFGTYFKDM